MTLTEEAYTRVNRGARKLDEIRPGWYDEIDVDRLNIAGFNTCIIGQLAAAHGSLQFCKAMYVVPLESVMGYFGFDKLPTRKTGYPFGLYDDEMVLFRDEVEWSMLQTAWLDAIADRRLSGLRRVEITSAVGEVAAMEAIGELVAVG